MTSSPTTPTPTTATATARSSPARSPRRPTTAIGLTGLAYGAHIMPVRVLDSQGEGEASTIAEGVRFAVNHHAQVINLSLEFSPGVTASDIPELIEALATPTGTDVLVVAAAGNEGHAAIAYPARAPDVVVGRRHDRTRLPGRLLQRRRRADARRARRRRRRRPPGRPQLPPRSRPGRDIFQVTFTGCSPRRFGLPAGLRRHLDGRPARRRDRRADHRQRRARPPPDAGADHRPAARDRDASSAAAATKRSTGRARERAAATAPGGPGAVAPVGASWASRGNTNFASFKAHASRARSAPGWTDIRYCRRPPGRPATLPANTPRVYATALFDRHRAPASRQSSAHSSSPTRTKPRHPAHLQTCRPPPSGASRRATRSCTVSAGSRSSSRGAARRMLPRNSCSRNKNGTLAGPVLST